MSPDDDNSRSTIILTKDTMVSHYRIVDKIGADEGLKSVEDARARLAKLRAL